jgi:excisionase family DNA binding protein
MKIFKMTEACEYVGVSSVTLKKLAYTGKIHSFETAGGHMRFRKVDLDAYMGVADPRPSDPLDEPSLTAQRTRKRAPKPHSQSTGQGKLRQQINMRLYVAMKRDSEEGLAIDLLGCSIAELKAHLESQFCDHPETGEPMTWDNWTRNGGWRITYIRPLSSFDLTDRVQQFQACHYTNIRPAWRTNLRYDGPRGTLSTEATTIAEKDPPMPTADLAALPTLPPPDPTDIPEKMADRPAFVKKYLAAGYSQTALAALLGVDPKQIRYWKDPAAARDQNREQNREQNRVRREKRRKAKLIKERKAARAAELRKKFEAAAQAEKAAAEEALADRPPPDEYRAALARYALTGKVEDAQADPKGPIVDPAPKAFPPIGVKPNGNGAKPLNPAELSAMSPEEWANRSGALGNWAPKPSKQLALLDVDSSPTVRRYPRLPAPATSSPPPVAWDEEGFPTEPHPGLPPLPQYKHLPLDMAERGALIQKYLDLGFRPLIIGKALGFSSSAISCWLKHYRRREQQKRDQLWELPSQEQTAEKLDSVETA